MQVGATYAGAGQIVLPAAYKPCTCGSVQIALVLPG